MRITKLGHCCLLIEEKGLRILTDPGAWSTLQNEVIGVDLVLITHEHQDHFHLDSLKAVLKNNADAKIITNTSVGALLQKENIPFSVIGDKEHTLFREVRIEGHGSKHAIIYDNFGQVENTGYFVGENFFIPVMLFITPGKTLKF